jgi:uncharacterized protein with gpF-like domain
MRDARPIISIYQSRRPSRKTIAGRLLKLNARLDAAAQPAIRRFLLGVSADVVRRINSATPDVDALFRPESYRPAFARVMLPIWKRAAFAGVEFEAAWIDKPADDDERQKFTVEDIESGAALDVEIADATMKEIVAWINTREVGLWETVGKTTRARLRKAIADGLKDGDTLKDLTARVQTVLKHYSKYQAKRVARTETTGSMNAGQQFERDELGIEYKGWVATKDRRTRGVDKADKFDHLRADGQIVANDRPFVVSGERLMFPGDSSRGASAGNVINCRCGAVAEFEPPKRQRRPRLSAAA